MNSDDADKFVKEYESQKSFYAAFAVAVKNILDARLKSSGFKYQIAARDKAPDSLRYKLMDRGFSLIKTVTEIQDLAGCRVLFYIESDVERFAAALHNEFEIVKRDDKYSSGDYNAVHFVVKLKENRVSLPEYAQFAGMNCEIQLSTVLYHAWSEMAHDIIYKPPQGLPEFDKRVFESLRKRFASVMEDHIKKASYGFEFINRQFEKLKEGKQVFNIDFLSTVEKSSSLDEIYQNLKLLAQYVAEFGDKTPKEFGLIDLLGAALARSRQLKRQQISTIIGEIEGHEFTDIANVCLEILDTLRYWYPEEVFEIVLEMAKSGEFEIKQHALKVLEHLSAYNYEIIRQVGYATQEILIRRMEIWTDPQISENIDALLTIGKGLLKAHFEHSSWTDEKTIAFSSGTLSVNEKLRHIRALTIEIIKRTFHILPDSHAKLKILDTLNQAISPSVYATSRGMDNLVLDAASKIFEFYIHLAASKETNGMVLEKIERQLRFFKRQFDATSLPMIERMESILKSNEEYQIFRILFGYAGRWAPDFDFDNEGTERTKKVEEFAANFSDATKAIWQERILAIMKDYDTHDTGQYAYFTDFLSQIAQRRPDLISAFIRGNEVALKPVLIHVVSGLWKSEQKETAKELIRSWVNNGQYLSDCALLFNLVREVDEELVDLIFEKAAQASDLVALNNLVNSIARNYEHLSGASSILIRIVRELTKSRNTEWIHNIWFYRESRLEMFSETDFDDVLENLKWLPDIGHEAEEILRFIAERYPQKIVELFHQRIGIELQQRASQPTRSYSAMPFDLHDLAGPLADKANDLIPVILSWFGEGGEKDNWLYQWNASQLLHIVFPNVGPILERHIVAYIENGDIDSLDNVFQLLRSYRGQGSLWGICKAIICKFGSHESYPEIESNLFGFLSQTGVVTGEYGFVGAYEAKRIEIKTWQDDKNPKCVQFMRNYDKYLEKMIIHSKKRADEDVQLRKMRFEERSIDPNSQ